MLFAFVAVAVATWLARASVHLVSWQDGAPARIALVPSLFALAALIAMAVVAFLLVTRFASRRVSALAEVCSPLTLLFLWGLPYLPWLPDAIPLVLILAGPVRWVVLGVAILGCVLAVPTSGLVGALQFRLPGPRAVFVISMLLFLALGGYVKYHQGVGGDEPHYLVIAHSLLVDGDLQIENNYEAGDYRSFWGGPLPIHFLQRGVDSVIYSVHAPGLPALIAPFYGLAGQWGAMVFVVLLASLAAAAMFGVAERLTNRRVAVATWLAVVLTVPFAPQAWLIFPEMPAAMTMALVVAWLFGPLPVRATSWLWRGMVVGFLPWLHMKYSFLLAGATVCLLSRLLFRRPIGHSVAMLVPMVLSGVLWFGSFYVMYGTPNPTVVYGYGAGAGLELSNIPRGVLGLLFDQEFGLLLYSPIYLLAVVGCWLMVQRRETRWPTIGLAATALGFVATVVPYYMWWGGWSVPARFLVPVLPVVAPMIAVALDRCRGAASRGVAGVLLLASMTFFALVTYEPQRRLLFNDRDGTGRLVETMQGGMNLTDVLPSFIQQDWASQLPRVVAWLGAGLLAGIVAFALGRRRVTLNRAFWSGAVCLVGFVMAGSLISGVSVVAGAGMEVFHKGQQSLIAAYDGTRLITYDFRDRAVLSEGDLFERATIEVPLAERVPPDVSRPMIEQGRVAGPFALAAGRYVARVWLRETARGGVGENDEVWVAFHRGPHVLGRGSVASANPVEITLDLPVTFDPVWVGATSNRLADAISHVQIEPISVIPRTDRATIANIREVASMDGVAGRYEIHVDDNIFSESDGFWVRGGQVASLYLTPGDADVLRITVRNGGTAGPVVLDVDGRREFAELGPHQQHEFTVALTGNKPHVPLTIESVNGFRPSEQNAESRDNRWLGCWVTLRLE